MNADQTLNLPTEILTEILLIASPDSFSSSYPKLRISDVSGSNFSLLYPSNLCLVCKRWHNAIFRPLSPFYMFHLDVTEWPLEELEIQLTNHRERELSIVWDGPEKRSGDERTKYNVHGLQRQFVDTIFSRARQRLRHIVVRNQENSFIHRLLDKGSQPSNFNFEADFLNITTLVLDTYETWYTPIYNTAPTPIAPLNLPQLRTLILYNGAISWFPFIPLPKVSHAGFIAFDQKSHLKIPELLKRMSTLHSLEMDSFEYFGVSALRLHNDTVKELKLRGSNSFLGVAISTVDFPLLERVMVHPPPPESGESVISPGHSLLMDDHKLFKKLKIIDVAAERTLVVIMTKLSQCTVEELIIEEFPIPDAYHRQDTDYRKNKFHFGGKLRSIVIEDCSNVAKDTYLLPMVIGSISPDNLTSLDLGYKIPDRSSSGPAKNTYEFESSLSQAENFGCMLFPALVTLTLMDLPPIILSNFLSNMPLVCPSLEILVVDMSATNPFIKKLLLGKEIRKNLRCKLPSLRKLVIPDLGPFSIKLLKYISILTSDVESESTLEISSSKSSNSSSLRFQELVLTRHPWPGYQVLGKASKEKEWKKMNDSKEFKDLLNWTTVLDVKLESDEWPSLPTRMGQKEETYNSKGKERKGRKEGNKRVETGSTSMTAVEMRSFPLLPNFPHAHKLNLHLHKGLDKRVPTAMIVNNPIDEDGTTKDEGIPDESPTQLFPELKEISLHIDSLAYWNDVIQQLATDEGGNPNGGEAKGGSARTLRKVKVESVKIDEDVSREQIEQLKGKVRKVEFPSNSGKVEVLKLIG